MAAALEAVLFVSARPVPRARLLEMFDEGDRAEAALALEAVLGRYGDGVGTGSAGRGGGGRRPAGDPARAARLAAPLLRGRRRHPAVDGGAGDPGHRRLPPAGDRARDPGAAQRQPGGGAQDPAREAPAAHRRAQGGGGQAVPLHHHPRVPRPLRAQGPQGPAAAGGVRGGAGAGERERGRRAESIVGGEDRRRDRPGATAPEDEEDREETILRRVAELDEATTTPRATKSSDGDGGPRPPEPRGGRRGRRTRRPRPSVGGRRPSARGRAESA